MENLALQAIRIAIVGVAAWLFLAPSAGFAAEPVRIAILPIVVHSADDPTYLRAGLADMITSRIDQAGGFEVVRIDDVEFATTRIGTAIAHGAKAGADYVLFGSFTRFGTGASLDMQCVSTDANFEGDALREIFVHTGSVGEVIPDLDDLVGKVGRFAIEGFGSVPDVAAAPPVSEGGTAKATLEARIEALEKALAAITPNPEPAKP
ncbi:MAG: TolB-like protein [Myxococcota bacterium]